MCRINGFVAVLYSGFLGIVTIFAVVFTPSCYGIGLDKETVKGIAYSMLDELQHAKSVSRQREIVESLCELKNELSTPSELLEFVIKKAIAQDDLRSYYIYNEYVDWVVHICHFDNGEVLSAAARNLEIEPGVKRDRLLYLLRRADVGLDNETATEMCVRELPTSIENVEASSFLLRYILRFKRTSGLRRLIERFELQSDFTGEDIQEALAIEKAVAKYGVAQALGREFDAKAWNDRATKWLASSIWLKQLYVLELTKEYPELIGVSMLEQFTQDSSAILRRSAIESLENIKEAGKRNFTPSVDDMDKEQ